MPINYTKWTNFWENLTLLDSSHLELFLGIFWEFFIFWIQIWILNLGRFGTGPNRNRTGPVWSVTGQTGPVLTGLVNPAWKPSALSRSSRQQISTPELIQRSCNGWFCTLIVASWHCQPFPLSMACDLHVVNKRTNNLGSNSMTGSHTDHIDGCGTHHSGTIVYSRNLLCFLDAVTSLCCTIFYLYMSYGTFGFRD